MVPAERDPLRLLSITEAATVMGVRADEVTRLLDRRELAEHILPTSRTRKRYTSRMAIEAWQREAIVGLGRQDEAMPVPIGKRRKAPP